MKSLKSVESCWKQWKPNESQMTTKWKLLLKHIKSFIETHLGLVLLKWIVYPFNDQGLDAFRFYSASPGRFEFGASQYDFRAPAPGKNGSSGQRQRHIEPLFTTLKHRTTTTTPPAPPPSPIPSLPKWWLQMRHKRPLPFSARYGIEQIS